MTIELAPCQVQGIIIQGYCLPPDWINTGAAFLLRGYFYLDVITYRCLNRAAMFAPLPTLFGG